MFAGELEKINGPSWSGDSEKVTGLVKLEAFGDEGERWETWSGNRLILEGIWK